MGGINISISNNITIKGLSPEQTAHIKAKLTIENPTFHKILRITHSPWAAVRDFKYYKQVGDLLIIPRGMRSRLIKWLDKMEEYYEVTEDIIKTPMASKMRFKGVLRDYQVSIVAVGEIGTEGIIKASTGSGKTLFALYIAARLGLKTTIIVPNTVLLKQFSEDCQSFFGFKPALCGENSKEIGDLTIATIQSLQADDDLCQKVIDNTAFLCVDECQGFVSKERIKTITQFKPYKILGLSATPERSDDDGRTEAVPFVFGDIVVNYESEQMKPTVEVIYTGVNIPVDEYHRMIDEMVASDSRNTLIAGLVIGETMENRKVLVLVKRIEHWKSIQKKLGKMPGFYYIDSEDKNRNETLMKMKSGELNFKAIFGTTSLLSVGTDIPALDLLIIASDMKSNILTIQSAGRIMRLFKDKNSPRIIDLFDNKNPILKRQGYERFKVYEQKGWPIIGLFKKKAP